MKKDKDIKKNSKDLQKIESSISKVIDKKTVTKLINKVLDNTVVDMPPALIDEKVNAIKAQYEQQAKMYNIPFETFLGFG